MPIQSLTDEILLVTLPKQPQFVSEVERATHMIAGDKPRHVIVDFSLVDRLLSPQITELIVLESELHEVDRQLILCCVAPKVSRLLTQASLHSLFRFADSEFAALQMLAACECYYG